MTLSRTVQLASAAALGAAVFAQAALAAGEPKNVSPFTQPAGVRLKVHLTSAPPVSIRSSATLARGEAKNGLPFTRPVKGFQPR